VSIALLLGIGALAAWGIRRRPSLALPVAWFVLWMLPVLNLWALDPQWIVTDRYLFLPSLALPWAIALVVPRRAAASVLALLAIVWAALAFRYERIFESEQTFVAAMEKAEPTSALVLGEKARLLRGAGDVSGAMRALERAVALDPKGPGNAIALADLEVARGDLESAERHYRASLVVRPYASKGFKQLVLAHARAGRRDRALALAEESARRWPDDFEVRLLQALLLADRGERARAEEAFAAARRARPDDPAVAHGLDAALAQIGPALGLGTRRVG
jgi:tetratricopeptide (TPR) repeat protein